MHLDHFMGRTGYKGILLLFGVFMACRSLAATTGTITGKVEVPSYLENLLVSQGYSSLYHRESPSPLKWPEMTVVYLETVSGKYVPPSRPAVIRHQANEFIPGVLPVLKGTTVSITTEDAYDHPIRSCSLLDPPLKYRLKAGGSPCSFRTLKTGEIHLSCSAHLRSDGFVLVLQNPFFATVDPEGTFVLMDVPAGTYRLCAWHPSLSPVQAEVTVSRGKESSIDLAFERTR